MKETESFEAFDWPEGMELDNNLLGVNLNAAISTLLANALTKKEVDGLPIRFFRVRVTALYGDL